ncbi:MULTISPECIES: NUDIX hydrolase [Streptomyces]|uniref:NUDIX hydrolase n=1 Tax=Streptomyces TaxID=1883 RepID=UPI0003725100|nr:NUDIX domain-containing protein [Streptomyces sp. AA0539]
MPIPRAVAVVVDGHRVLVIQRYRKTPPGARCTLCEATGHHGPGCPGHHYTLLPGGHVEDGESSQAAAVRELREETSLDARIDRLVWTGLHYDRPARYYLMTDIRGRAVLSGEEAEPHGPDNTYRLRWAAPGDFAALNLVPADIRAPLTRLLEPAAGAATAGDRPRPSGAGPD